MTTVSTKDDICTKDKTVTKTEDSVDTDQGNKRLISALQSEVAKNQMLTEGVQKFKKIEDWNYPKEIQLSAFHYGIIEDFSRLSAVNITSRKGQIKNAKTATESKFKRMLWDVYIFLLLHFFSRKPLSM